MHSHPDAHGAFEGRSTRRYDFLARRVLRRYYRRIAEDLALLAPDGAAVLDVGTGPGVLLTETAERRPDITVTGIDPSADMVTAAERNIASFGDRARARVGSATEIPFGYDEFDLIVTSLSLHHWGDIAAAVPELARVLRPGGQIVVYDVTRAPFDEFHAAVDRLPGLAAGTRHTTIRTGIPRVRHIERHTLESLGAAQPR